MSDIYGPDTRTLPYRPERSSYAYNNASGVITASLAGGLSRSRLDVVGHASLVSCTWFLTQDEYNYFMIFYNAIAQKGAESFVASLILDKEELQDFNCKFVPDSLQLTEPTSLSYQVSAQLEVEPIQGEYLNEADVVYLRRSLDLSVSDYSARSYGFDGVDDFIQTPDVVLDGDFTISVDVYSTDSADFALFGGGYTVDGEGARFTWDDSLQLFYISTDDATQDHFGFGAAFLPKYQWANITLVRDSGVIRFYFNGFFVSQITLAVDDFTVRLIASAVSDDWFFEGRLRNFNAFSRVLNSSEIAYIARGILLAQNPFTAGAELRYRMDEGVGIKTYDTSDSAKHGTPTNAAASTLHVEDLQIQKKPTYSFELDDYVAHPAITLNADYTIAFWFKPDSEHRFGIVGGGTDNTLGSDYKAMIQWEQPSNSWQVIKDGDAALIQFTPVDSAPVVDEWQHIMLRNKDGEVKFFSNGELVHEDSVAAHTLTLRTFGWAYSTAYKFNGSIRNYQIYTEALSHSEMMYLYSDEQFGVRPSSDNAEAIFAMQEASGSTAIDISPQTNEGTITGATRVIESHNYYYIEPALTLGYFNDTSSGNIEHSSVLLDGDLTFSFFVRFDSFNTTNALLGGGLATTGDTYTARLVYRDDTTRWIINHDATASLVNFTADIAEPTVGVWKHIAVTREGVVFKIYEDGILVDTVSDSGVYDFTLRTFGWSVSAATTFLGSLRMYYAYSKALTADEVLYLATEGSDGILPSDENLEVHYKGDELDGVLAKDYSGNDRHGTMTSYVNFSE